MKGRTNAVRHRKPQSTHMPALILNGIDIDNLINQTINAYKRRTGAHHFRDEEDLRQDLRIAAWTATQRFNPTLNNDPAGWIAKRLRGALLDHLRTNIVDERHGNPDTRELRRQIVYAQSLDTPLGDSHGTLGDLVPVPDSLDAANRDTTRRRLYTERDRHRTRDVDQLRAGVLTDSTRRAA